MGLLGAQGFFSLLLFGDVLQDADRPRRAAGRIALDHVDQMVDMDDAALRIQETVVHR